MGHCLFPPPQNLNMLWARRCLVPLSCPCSCLGAGPSGPRAAPRPSRGAFLLPPDPVGGVVHPPDLVRSPGSCQQACPGRRKLCSLAVRDFLRVPWWLFRGLGLFEHLCDLQLGSGSLFLGHIGSSAAGLWQSWSLQRRDDRPFFVHSWAALQLGSGSLSLVHLGGFAAWQWFFAPRAPCGFAAWHWEPDLRTPPWRCIWQWGPVLGTPCSFAMMAASSYTLVASSLAAGVPSSYTLAALQLGSGSLSWVALQWVQFRRTLWCLAAWSGVCLSVVHMDSFSARQVEPVPHTP